MADVIDMKLKKKKGPSADYNLGTSDNDYVVIDEEEYDALMADIMRMPPEERCNWTFTMYDNQNEGTPCKFDGKDILNYSDIAHKFVKVLPFNAEMRRRAVPQSSLGKMILDGVPEEIAFPLSWNEHGKCDEVVFDDSHARGKAPFSSIPPSVIASHCADRPPDMALSREDLADPKVALDKMMSAGLPYEMAAAFVFQANGLRAEHPNVMLSHTDEQGEFKLGVPDGYKKKNNKKSKKKRGAGRAGARH